MELKESDCSGATGGPGEKQPESDNQSNFRICTKCRAKKQLDDFDRNKSKPAGRDNRCKTCVAKSKAAAYQAKKRAEVARRHRRNRTCVVNIQDAEINDIYVPSPEEPIRAIIDDFVEMVLCRQARE